MFINKLLSSSNSYYYPLSENIQPPNKVARVIAYIVCGILIAVTFYNICSHLFWGTRSVKQQDPPGSPNTPEPEPPTSDQTSQTKTKQIEIINYDDEEDVNEFLGVGVNSPPSDPNEAFIIRTVDWNKVRVPGRTRNYSEYDDFSGTPSQTPLYSRKKKKFADPLTPQ